MIKTVRKSERGWQRGKGKEETERERQRETQNTENISPTYFELFAKSEFQLSPKVCKVCSMFFLFPPLPELELRRN